MDKALMRAVERLREMFPGKSPSWIARALLRLPYVREVGSSYVVEGIRELGDVKPVYYVWWEEREKRWVCTCYFSWFGYARKREVCTHVAAVMLYRRYKAYAGGEVYYFEAELECADVSVKGASAWRVEADRRTLADWAKPAKVKIYAVSSQEEITVVCDGKEARLRGVKTHAAIAQAAMGPTSS